MYDTIKVQVFKSHFINEKMIVSETHLSLLDEKDEKKTKAFSRIGSQFSLDH